MPDILIRDVSDETASALDALAAQQGKSRQQLLQSLITQATQPQPRIGGGYKCYLDDSKAVISNYGDTTVMTCNGVEPDVFRQLERAWLMTKPQNGGKWREAREVLEMIGFEVFEF